MPKVRWNRGKDTDFIADVEELDGIDRDLTCINHGRPFEDCKKCGARYCDGCIEYTMERGRGLCGKCGRRAYADEIHKDIMDTSWYEPEPEPMGIGQERDERADWYD